MINKTTLLVSLVFLTILCSSAFSQNITIDPIAINSNRSDNQVAIVQDNGNDVGYVTFHTDRRPIPNNFVYILANYYDLSNSQVGSPVEPLGGGNSSEYTNSYDWQLVTDDNLGIAATFEQGSKDATGFYTINPSNGVITEILNERAATGISGLNGAATVGILNNGNLIFVYANAYSLTAGEISFDIINPNNGSTIVTNVAVTTQASTPAVTPLSDGGFFIAYAQGTTDPFNTKGKRYSASGALVGSELTIFNQTATDSNTTSTMLSNGNLLIQESGMAKIYDVSGNGTPVQVGDVISIYPGEYSTEESCVIDAFDNGGFVAVYVASDDVVFQNIGYRVFDNNGNSATLGQIPITSNLNNNRVTEFPDVAAFSDGGFVVSFGNNSGSVAAPAKIERAVVKNMHPVIDLDSNNSSGAIGKNYTAVPLNGQSGGVAVADADVLVTDPDGETISSITIDISNRLDGANEFLTLAIASGLNISGSGGKTITLTDAGSATKSNFQAALAAIRYFNSTASNTTTRTIVTTVTDDNNLTSSASTSIAIISGSGSPEINIQGNSQTIADGDLNPRTLDLTDFGSHFVGDSNLVRTFTIQNTGSSNLNLAGGPNFVTISGSPDFTISSQPGSNPISAAGSTTFQVRLDPTTLGTQNATVSLSSNDADESPYTFRITASISDVDSDGNLTIATGVSHPVSLNTTIDTVAEAIDVLAFNLIDGGTSDGLAMGISEIAINVSGTSTDSDRNQVIWRLNGPNANNVVGNYSAIQNTIKFSGLGISIADASSERYTVNAFFGNNSNIIDNRTFVLSVNGSADVIVNSGTKMGATTAVTNGLGGILDVVATRLRFATQPSGMVSGLAATTQPVVSAVDIANNIDRDFNESIFINWNPGGGPDPVNEFGNAISAVNGLATFTNFGLTVTIDGRGVQISADDAIGGLDLIPVNSGILFVEVVASQLIFSTQPAGSVSGSNLTTQPVVMGVDANGVLDNDFTETITLTENSAGSLSGTSVSAIAGVATFNNVKYTASVDQEAFTLTANDQDGVGANFMSVNANSVTSDVVATGLSFTTQPAGSVSGLVLSTQPAVSAVDANGITDTDFTETITLSENGSGSITGDSIAAVSGVATFTALNYTATADQETFTLTANDQDAVGADFGTVNANAITSDVVATNLVFTTQPAGSVSGSNLTTQPVVTARDASGLTDTGFTETITLSENAAGSLTVASIAAVSGIATFTAVNYSASVDQEAFTLTANDQDGVGSNMGTVDANAITSDVVATALEFSTQPAGSVSGVPLTTQPVVVAVDSDGTTDTGFTETITLTENSSGSITGDSISAVAGVATFSALTYTATSDQETFTLTANDQDAVGADFGTVNANALTSDVIATNLVFSTQPAGSVSGSNLATQPVVLARDAGGITDTGFAETITLTEKSAGSISGSSVAAVNGVATFTNVNYTASVDQESFTLTADDQGGIDTDLSSVNANAVMSDVVATQLLFDTQPSPLSVPSSLAISFDAVPTVSARDDNNVVDIDYSTGVVLSKVNGAGAVLLNATVDIDVDNSTVTVIPSSGIANYLGAGITYTVSGVINETFNLQASSGSLILANSDQLIATLLETPDAPDLDTLSDTGINPNDNNTNDDTPSFSGIVFPGSTVTLNSSISGNVGSVISDSTTGNWSITSSQLSEGIHEMSVVTQIGSSNISNPSPSLSVTIDTTAPRINSILRLVPNTSPTNADSISWKVDFNEDVYNISHTDFMFLGTTAIASSNQVSNSEYDILLSGGNLADLDEIVSININANGSDRAGNTPIDPTPLITDESDFVIDNTGPDVTISSPSSSIVNSSAVNVTYTVNYSDATSISLVTGDITLNTTGTANATINVTNPPGVTLDKSRGEPTNSSTITLSNFTGDGTLGVSIAAETAEDSLGNLSPASGPSSIFIVDNTAPVISLTGSNSIVLTVGDIYVDEAAIATDNVDDNIVLTDNIDVNNPVNTSIVGDYLVTYDVDDTAGNSAMQVTRNVTVLATVGGTISGLAKGNSVTLENSSNGNTLLVTNDGEFTFSTTLAINGMYSISVIMQPLSPVQTCTVTNEAGIISTTNITDVLVTCTTNQYFIGGALSGLSPGNSLTLELNDNKEQLPLSANGGFAFAMPLDDLSDYSINVAESPISPSQTCEIQNDSGQINAADVVDVLVDCSTDRFFIGGRITGLAEGYSLRLENNSTDELLLSNNGAFVFATPLSDLSSYEVDFEILPANTSRDCNIQNEAGELAGDDIDDILIRCNFFNDFIFDNGFEFTTSGNR